jgi:SAM-dependent methyltransferase
VLKTDLFEEACGADQILFDLFPEAGLALGVDLAWSTAQRARQRYGGGGVQFLVSDVRSLAIRSNSLDAVVSTSTLDHFLGRGEFCSALMELKRVLRPGGALIITLDNVRNPLYALARVASWCGWTPYRLGYTVSRFGLVRHLEEAGLEVLATDLLIHNPRLVSTLLFLGLRRLLGRRADGVIRALLRLFATLGGLPTRNFSACFVAACARKPRVVAESRGPLAGARLRLLSRDVEEV